MVFGRPPSPRERSHVGRTESSVPYLRYDFLKPAVQPPGAAPRKYGPSAPGGPSGGQTLTISRPTGGFKNRPGGRFAQNRVFRYSGAVSNELISFPEKTGMVPEDVGSETAIAMGSLRDS